MKKLNENNYVHSDLSEFNILNLNNEPVFIDLSQTTTLENQQTKEFRDRDIKNIARFLPIKPLAPKINSFFFFI